MSSFRLRAGVTFTIFTGSLRKYIHLEKENRGKWIPVAWKLESDGLIEESPMLWYNQLSRHCPHGLCARWSVNTVIDLEHYFLETTRKCPRYRNHEAKFCITLRRKDSDTDCSYYLADSRSTRDEWVEQLEVFCPKLRKKSKTSVGDEEAETVEIGKGGFGVVYRWKQPESGNITALKVQDAPGEDLEWESTVLQNLQSVEGFPKLHSCSTGELGWLTNKKYMVTEYIGPDLETIVEVHGAIGPKVLSGIAVRLLDSLAAMHDLGFIHHDLKPANICLREKSVEPVIIDFGLSIKYNKEWNFVKQRDSFDGTFMYTSIRNHLRQPQSSRDDVESLLYTLTTVLLDKVPWYEPRPPNSDKDALERRERRIRDKKIRFPYQDGTPRCISYALTTAFATMYNDKPPIDNIKAALTSEWNPVVTFKYRPANPKLQWTVETIDKFRRTTNPLKEAFKALRKARKAESLTCGYSDDEIEALWESQEPAKEVQRELAEVSHKDSKLRKVMANILWQQQSFIHRKIGKKLRRVPSALSHQTVEEAIEPSVSKPGEADDESGSQRKNSSSLVSIQTETEQSKLSLLTEVLLRLELPPKTEFPVLTNGCAKSLSSLPQTPELVSLKTQLRAIVLDLWQQIEAYFSAIGGVCHEKCKQIAPEFLRELQDLAQYVVCTTQAGRILQELDHVKSLLLGKQKELETAKQRLYWDCDGNRLCDPDVRKGPEGAFLSKVMVYFSDLIRICEDFILTISSEEVLNNVEKIMAFFEGICPFTPVAIGTPESSLPKKAEILVSMTKELLTALEESYEAVFATRMPRVFVRVFRKYMKELTGGRAGVLNNADEIYAVIMKVTGILFELRKFELILDQIKERISKGEQDVSVQKYFSGYFRWPAYRFIILEIGLFLSKMECEQLDEVLIPTLATAS